MFELFPSNKRSVGRWDPETGKAQTAHRAYTEADFAAHFYGEVGIGLVPIDDASTCQWGAIDIDAHGSAEDINLGILAKKVHDLNLPLIVCRSKSGGAHLYTFYREPVPAEIVRRRLTKWATDLGYGGAEVFPKQSRLLREKESGKLQLGNYINLPWFAAFDDENPLNNRYSVVWDEIGARRITFEEFLDRAEQIAKLEDTYTNTRASEHPEAPPCLQKMMMVGVPEGYRNEAMFNFAVYLRRAYPDDWRDRVQDVNAQVLEEPLAQSEIKKIMGSVGRRTYRYRCQQEPCKSLCNSKICLTRQYGITPQEVGGLGDPDTFENLRRVNTDPPRWVLRVNGQDVPLTTDQLMRYQSLEVKVLEHVSIVLKPMKPDEWRLKLSDLMRTMTVVEVPEDASASGQMFDRLIEYLAKTVDGTQMTPEDRLRNIELGRPVRVLQESGDWAVFKGSEFIKHLKRTKGEDIKGPELWMSLSKFGLDHDVIKIKGKSVRVWKMPYTAIEDMDAPDLKVEI